MTERQTLERLQRTIERLQRTDMLNEEVWNGILRITIAKVYTSRIIECSICLNTLDKPSPVVVLICNHEFHQPCFEQWKKSCPNCRRVS
jgi:hypothetical protein